MIDEAFAELVDAGVDVRRACKLVGRPRSTHYWRARPKPAVPAQRRARPTPANALSEPERDRVLALLRIRPLWTSRRRRCGPEPGPLPGRVVGRFTARAGSVGATPRVSALYT